MIDTPATVTIADVARVAGVSKMTVSNVINNKPGMTEETRERVRRAIEQTGYVVNPAARALSNKRLRSNLIGVLTPQLNWPWVAEILHGASTTAEAAGLNLAIFTTASNPALERERATLLRTLADGVLVVIPTADEQHIFGNDIPVVTLGAYGQRTVQVDNHAGGYLATRHLVELGHTRIAHLAGKHDTTLRDALDRQAGYHAALRDAGLSAPDAYLQQGEFSETGGELATRILLALPERPTAIFAANDLSAIGALRAASALGLRVPEDLSIVGFDDIHAAAVTDPPLTTVRQPLEEIGQAAVQLLIQLTRGQSADPHVRFPATLVTRGSTAPPSQEASMSP
ncbi:LacI family DNA-binding transcriptional regulator [Deinococcus yavapaiensis]|uniref:LacI family transcriptional regulator n=1 Tax=Deinococcus yavapaiensis KR-236 TaxID=694435 RepID=A0A318S6V7_9DEIO|nr:LacI family DNA-binding transcriptional regulator [Deinococcus yavapaiensis]PYE50570.1 LacI family transcriptional regulator [Deinococcus yavapaiensis KR-236]